MVPAEVRELLSNKKPDIDDVTWVKPEKYHITFEYFTDLSHESFDEVHRKVQALSTYFPLQCEAQCFSGFPLHGRARVIIARLTLANPGISTVCENKRFDPHITVGYARSRPVVVPETMLNHRFTYVRPALFQSRKGSYIEIH